MNRLYVQVFRGGEWRHVTSISFESGFNSGDADQKYDRAYREAARQLGNWRGYFVEPLRIAEETIRGGFKEALP